jgi:H+/Cl- antiporter ClcA
MGTALGDRLKAGVARTRILALAGIAGVFSGFLRTPLGGAFLSYEFTGLVRFPFYEHLVAATVASLSGFAVFASLTAFNISGVLELPPLAGIGVEEILVAGGLGLVGLPVALAFKFIFGATRQAAARLGERTVLRATLGGLGFGLIGAALPLTLYSGEAEIIDIIHGEALPLTMLLILAGAKLVTLSLCLATGFPGGFIFPLLFSAGCLGVAVNQVLPEVPLTLAVAGSMASVGGAVMRMPFATILLVGVLAGTDLMPLAAVSAIVAFALALPVAPGGAPEALRQAEEASA